MIKINDIQLDCIIKFTTSRRNVYEYEVTTLDGSILKSHMGWRDTNSLTLAPRSQEDCDLIISEIENSGGYISLTYPLNKTQVATRNFYIDEFSYDVERDKPNDYKFGVINCQYTEVKVRA